MDKMRRTSRAGWFWISLCFAMGSPALSHADLSDILLRFQPYIAAQEEYTNNVNSTSQNKTADFITTISPGIRFSTVPRSDTTRETPTQQVEPYGIDFDYRLGLVFYAKETNNNYIAQNGTLNAWYTIASRLTFRVSEYLIRSQEPREPEYPGFSPAYVSGTFIDLTTLYLPGTQRQRFIYLRNVVTPSVEYRFGRESLVSLNYRNNILRSQNPAAQDSEENFINARLTHWFDIRNGITLDYGLTFGSFQNSPDLTGNALRGRYTYRFNPRTSVFGEYTFLLQNFGPPGIDYYVQAPSIGFAHAFSPTLSCEVQAGYFWQNPEKGSGSNGPTYNVLINQRDVRTTYALLFQGGYQENFFGTGAENRGFAVYHRAVGAVTYRFAERVTGGLSGSFEYDKSGLLGQSGPLLPVNQRDKLWMVSGNVAYQLLRWLNLEFSLTYREDNSNVATLDYTEFRGLFRVTAAY